MDAYQEFGLPGMSEAMTRRVARRYAYRGILAGFVYGIGITVAVGIVSGWMRPSGPLIGAQRIWVPAGLIGPPLVGPIIGFGIAYVVWRRRLRGRQIVLGRITSVSAHRPDGAIASPLELRRPRVTVHYVADHRLRTWYGPALTSRSMRTRDIIDDAVRLRVKLVWLAVREATPPDIVFAELARDPDLPDDLPWTWPYRNEAECPWTEAVRQWELQVREDFLSCLRQSQPTFEILECSDEELKFRESILGEGLLRFASLYQAIANLDPCTEAARADVFEGRCGALAESRQPFSFSTQGDQVLPRLLSAEESKGALRRPLAGTALFIGYVVNREHSMAMLREESAASLGIDPDELHQRALSNLAPAATPIADAVREVLEGGGSVAFLDMTHTAATCALLIPGCLREGEAIGIAIPDRESLILAPVPDDGDWSSLAEVPPGEGAGHLISDVPFRVTAAGFEPVDVLGVDP